MSELWDSLDEMDWSSINHAHGPAVEVPDLLRALRTSEPEARMHAYQKLARLLVHQGSRYEASAAAAPFLIEVVADRNAPDRFVACQVLAAIAIGDESSWLNNRPDLPARRQKVQRQASLSVEELKRAQAEWVAAAPTESERQARASRAQWTDVEMDRDAFRWEVEAYDAVRAGVPAYIAALEASDEAVRLYVAYLLAWFPEDCAIISSALTRLLAHESDPIVAATACVSAGLCGHRGDQALIDVVSARRTSLNRGERWSAVLGLAHLLTHPDRSITEDLYACLFEAVGKVPYWPFLDGDMSAMAALTIRDLGSDTIHDRVQILVERLVNVGFDAAEDRFMLIQALLDAAFPGGPLHDGTSFLDLDVDQRKAVLAIWQTRALHAGPMIVRLLGRYNLPGDETELQDWCGLGTG